MTDVTTQASVLDDEALAELRQGFGGVIAEPGDAAYDEARVVFNGMFDRRPAVVLRPSGTADVIRAIGLARLSGLPLAVRGGGHSVAGFSSCDGGIVLDLRDLRGMRVDPHKRTARAQAGVNWGQFDRETQAFGLATTGGRVTTTGVHGFTLGSGSGWLERMLGLAGDLLVSADVVTADGDVVTATKDENAELLWGLRGGGGNFGVVTEMEFRLAPVGPLVYGGLMAFHPSQQAQMLRIWRDISESAPEELGWAAASVTAPPEEFVPVEAHGLRVPAVAGLFAGDHDEAIRVLEPLRALKPVVDLWQPMPYTVAQGLLDPPNPYGRRNYWRAHNLDDCSDGLLDTFMERAEAIASPFTAFILIRMGGAVERVGENDTALGGRRAPFNIHLNCMWEDPNDDERNVAWVKDTTTALGAHLAPGMALNFFTEIGDAELADSYGEKLTRLRALKDRYDPTNLFRLNQNIAPSA